VAQGVSPAILYSMVLPSLKPCLAYNIIAVDEADVLANALRPPLSRAAYDYIVNLSNMEELKDVLVQQLIRRQQLTKSLPPDNQQRILDTFHRAGATESDEVTATIMDQHLTRVRSSVRDYEKPLSLTPYLPPSPQPLSLGPH